VCLAPPQYGKRQDSGSQEQQGARFGSRASAARYVHTRRKINGLAREGRSGGNCVEPPGGNSPVTAETPGGDGASRIREKVGGRLRVEYARARSGESYVAARIHGYARTRNRTETRIAASKHAELPVCRKSREGKSYRGSGRDPGDGEEVEIIARHA